MTLSAEQQRVAGTFDRVADRRRLRPLIRKALFEAGLVETNLTNPPGGDGTSVGSLQETSPYGSVARRLDVTKAATRFVNEAEALVKNGFRGSAGQLAQAVQRSAYPGRYDQRGADAVRVIRRYGGYGPGGVPAGATAAGANVAGDVAAPALLPATTQPVGTVPSLSSLIDARQRMSRSTAPDYNVLSTPAQSALPSTPDMTAVGYDTGASSASSTPRVPSPSRGSVHMAPGADRAGVTTSQAVKRFVARIADIAGRTLTIGTGTNHNRLTINGNVSDHYSGHAGDIPATGKELIRLGQDALIAAGMPAGTARRKTGGLYNVNGHQIIFNTMEGGDHTNHLHVSAY